MVVERETKRKPGAGVSLQDKSQKLLGLLYKGSIAGFGFLDS